MTQKNYDICKQINNYYFTSNTNLSLIIPNFFDENTEEYEATCVLKNLIEDKQLEKAVELAEQYIARFPIDANAFLVWQIYAYWNQKKIPNEEFIAYFDSLEEIYPDQAFANFDKAVLLIADEKFNEAVDQLKIARKKDPEHIQTLSLLFLIYYLSQDDQWRMLYAKVQKGGFLPEKITHLIAIGEAIREKRQAANYIFGDRADPVGSNVELLQKFPTLRMMKEPTEKNIILVAAETNYFRLFVTTFIVSALELPSRNFGIHIHLYGPMGVDLELLKDYDEKYPELKLSYSYEKAAFDIPFETGAYYAAMRFCRAYQIFEKTKSVEYLAVVDADALIRKDFFGIKDLTGGDFFLTAGTETGPYWDRFSAAFACFSRSDISMTAFAYMANIILKNTVEEKLFWFIDQVALYDMNTQFSPKAKIGRISADELFGKDLEHEDHAVFWTYTNEQKTMDNPMNWERKRLAAQYMIQPEWNMLAKGKYGTVVANRNDEYIGRQLLAYGSWCDNEIAILKFMLENGDTVIEVGSNIGSHTLPLAKIVGNSGRVIAMEPQRILFQTLCANISVNSMQNVFAMNVACGESAGILQVAELDPTAVQNFGGYQPKKNAGDIPVEIKTIDSLNLTSCKLIKMDIEGMELEAMKGARETLKKFEPVLFFESHGDGVYEIRNFLRDFGYNVYDFAIKNDPMFLAVTGKYEDFARNLNISHLEDAA